MIEESANKLNREMSVIIAGECFQGLSSEPEWKLDEILESKKSTAIFKVCAKAFKKAINGDNYCISLVLERVLGKIPDKVAVAHMHMKERTVADVLKGAEKQLVTELARAVKESHDRGEIEINPDIEEL